MFPTKALSTKTLEKEELRKDKGECLRFGPCGVGRKALYLNSFYIDRHYYVPYSAVSRVFKRVAMSKGGFTGKGMFATLAYLVVLYDNGQEKQCLFKIEETVDEMLDAIRAEHPEIKTLSAAAEQKLKKKRAEEAARPRPKLSPEAEETAKKLDRAIDYLEKRPALSRSLSYSAKAKRVNERSNPAYRWVALFIVLIGAAMAVYGVWAILTSAGFGIYFTLFGLAAVFLFAGANVLPTRNNNKKYIDTQLADACADMERYLNSYEGNFPVPACYAHPITLRRMKRLVLEGKAEKMDEAFEKMKEELKALNSDVKVEQEEYDEVVTIKPMFLVKNYE